jgi:hypothetical protein
MLNDPYQQKIYDRNELETKTFLLIYCSADVSFRFLGRKLEVVFLHDSAVGSGQSTERKTKNLGNIGLDIKTDLREFGKQSSSRRTSEGLRATTLKQYKGTSNNNPIMSKQFINPCSILQQYSLS